MRPVGKFTDETGAGVPIWQPRSALLERGTARERPAPWGKRGLRDGVRPVQAGDAPQQCLSRMRHAHVETARVDAHDVAANVAPGNQQGACSAIDVPVPAERHVRCAGAARALPFGVAGRVRIDTFGAQFREQSVVERGGDVDEMKPGKRALLEADIAVDVVAGQHGGRMSHAPDCSSLSHL